MPTHSRRALLRRVGLVGAAGLAGCAGGSGDGDSGENSATTAGGDGAGGAGSTATTDAGAGDTTDERGETTADGAGEASVPAQLTAEPLAVGFTSPVGVEFPAGTGRAYVADQRGTITVVDRETESGEGSGDGGSGDEGSGDGGSGNGEASGSTADQTTFLDVRDRMVSLSGYTEQGLLGIAFHPAFPDDDRVFVRYSAPSGDGTPSDYSHTFVLASFRATPDAADPATGRTLLEIPQPQANHNAGSVAFGPDGYLYVGVGDGGRANDQGNGHVDDWYDAVAGGNGQDVTSNLLGSVLRIDVDSGSRGTYTVPDDNPLVGSEGLPEQYAWGLRNPWRFSFDRETGDFYVADVGQGSREEVNRVVAGGNYGWNVREGTTCFGADDCPSTAPDGRDLRDPVIQYPHSGDGVAGVSVIGGYRYRGDGTPGLGGQYLFADWRAGGELFLATPGESTPWPTQLLPVEGSVRGNVLAFGEDPAGELYVCTTDKTRVTGETGAVHRVTGVDR